MSISNYMSLVLRNVDKPIILLFSTRFEDGTLMTIEALATYRELTSGVEYQTTTYTEVDAETAALGPWELPLTEAEIRSILALNKAH